MGVQVLLYEVVLQGGIPRTTTVETCGRKQNKEPWEISAGKNLRHQHGNQHRLRRCRACSNRDAACCSGGMAHRLGPRAARPIGLRATPATVAASHGGGRAHLSSPVPSQPCTVGKPVIPLPAASCRGGRARRLLTWRQVPRVACRAWRH